MALATFVVMVLCTARLTRIVTTDSITASLRLRVWRRFPPEPRAGNRAHPLGQLIDCPWCIGYWFAGAVTFVAALIRPEFDGIVWPLMTWQAVAWAAAVAARWFDPAPAD